MERREENNYPKAFLATGILLGALFALCYFIVFTNPPVQEMGTGGILVNYGTTDEGSGKDITSVEEPSKAEKANHTQPTKVTEAPPNEEKSPVDNSNTKVVTQTTEDAPEVVANAKKASAKIATEAAKPVKKPVVNQNALYKGATNKGTGQGDGTTNTPGNQGSKDGSALSPDYGAGGSGGGIKGTSWSFVEPPEVTNPHRVPGRVVIDVVIDKNGNIISAEYNKQKSKMADLALIDECIEKVKNSKLTSSVPATSNQHAEVPFIFQLD